MVYKGSLLYLCCDEWGLLFDKQTFFRIDLKSGERNRIINVRPSGVKGAVSHSRLASRLFRLEPRCVEILGVNTFVVCYAHSVWLLDIKERTFTELQKSRIGFSNPLTLCSDGQCVYWGDYGDNAGREEVRIYKLKPDLEIDIVYSFPRGSIRHIHSVIWDESKKRFYILTGDLEEASGIYSASADWSMVKPIETGRQQYRAVVGFPYKGGLIYATDSVAEENNIYLMGDGEVKTLYSFPGSCIYGTETRDFFVFSSTVEPPEGRGVMDLFSYKLGTGIKDRYAHIVKVRKSDLEVEEIMKLKKDIWPMKLFQYGVIMFPKGQKNSEDLWYYVMACKGDGKTNKCKI